MKVAVFTGIIQQTIEKQSNQVVIETEDIVACEASKSGFYIYMRGGFKFRVDEYSMKEIVAAWPHCPYEFDAIEGKFVTKDNARAELMKTILDAIEKEPTKETDNGNPDDQQ